MKSFQFEWIGGKMKGIYQIPLQEEYEIETQTQEWWSSSPYYKIIVIINAHSKKEAIKKFAQRYKVKFKNN